MPSISANTAWFTITLNGRTDFQVYSFSGSEAVCKPYEFVVEAVHPSAGEELTGVIGAPALLSIADRSGQSRLVHGLVREMRRLHRGNHLAHYQCVIVPRLWFLGQNREHRIFQGKSVPDIITLILDERGFASETFAFRCFHDYHPREYCVQYGESDLHFISRLCEEEGIYYYFEHSETGHCVCFSDMAAPVLAGNQLCAVSPALDRSRTRPWCAVRSFMFKASATRPRIGTGIFRALQRFSKLPQQRRIFKRLPWLLA